MTGILTSKVKIFIELLVVTAISYFMADACYALFFVEQNVAPKYVTRNISTKKILEKQVALSSFKLIEQRNLLKVKNAPPVPKKKRPKKKTTPQAISISKRGFHLLGTIFAEKPSESWAIVLYKNKQSLYRNGSNISGWKVVEIKRREIILQRGSAKERLLIDGKKATASRGSSGGRVVARSYIKKQLKDLSKVASSITIVPSTKGGRKGLHVQALRSGSFLYNMGLRKGDLLVKANGKSLTSFGDAASLMSMLDKNNISLNIIRKGKSQTLTFRLK